MEKLEVRILPSAAMKLSRQVEWYYNNKGKSFSVSLMKNNPFSPFLLVCQRKRYVVENGYFSATINTSRCYH